MARLECRGLRAGYGDNEVLHGVDLDVAEREWVVVIGPNGSGKSTLLRAVAGTLPATGDVRVTGNSAAGVATRRRSRLVAMVPQNPVIPDGMTVLDYVLLGRTPYIPAWGTESGGDLRVARRVLAELDLGSMADRVLQSLSGGELQRVVLARALAQEAPVLLLDEPTTALDVGHQQQVLELVDRLRETRSIAVLAAMHDLTLAAQYADRLVLLVDGRTAAAGAAETVLTSALLREHYSAQVTILRSPDGSVVVAPQRSTHSVPKGHKP
ncbi:MAG: ABC transporter ATP-binding protein [Acidimicrobiia bacterium]|nr:ABC transporter ATP-binding protein [Acidimicrobiia bacterium]MDH3397954.1 ABC transporter ATP-binding protein [Acidimicrobiia bacterium]